MSVVISPGPQVSALSALFFLYITIIYNYQSIAQKYYILNYVKQRKSANLNISEAGTTDNLPFVLDKCFNF